GKATVPGPAPGKGCDWICLLEQHHDLAGWLFLLGSMIALGIAILLPWWERRRSRRADMESALAAIRAAANVLESCADHLRYGGKPEAERTEAFVSDLHLADATLASFRPRDLHDWQALAPFLSVRTDVREAIRLLSSGVDPAGMGQKMRRLATDARLKE